MSDLKVWLDENCALNLTRDAVEFVEIALHAAAAAVPQSRGTVRAELQTAANLVRAHLQHLPRSK